MQVLHISLDIQIYILTKWRKVNNSMAFHTRSSENFPRYDRKYLKLFTVSSFSIFYNLPPICSHDFSRWETLTSDIKDYKNSCDALRPSSRKEIGTTVFTLNGVDAKLWHQNWKLKIYAIRAVALLFNDLLY